ncbi:hypothetical protein MPSEU_000906000 [Mayamaea pseudoterrestris]|nr:hypothetical protein MPSEU_000906000 [Mayamaea pseudoterrestris]
MLRHLTRLVEQRKLGFSLACMTAHAKKLSNGAKVNEATHRQFASHAFTFIDCHGDYRDELHLENPCLPLYSNQAKLPRLPIPSLEETAENFLQSALPLAKSKEQVDTLLAAAKVFPEQAAHLQQRLLQRRQEYNDSSWLQHWWNEQVYLQCRDALFYSSFFYRLAYDDSCRRDGTLRAAAALQALTILSQRVCSGRMPPDTAGRSKIPLCSTQYKYLFHSCRIPQPKQDLYRIYSPNTITPTPIRLHVAVACKGQFYKVYVTDDDGRVYCRAALQKALRKCREQSMRDHDKALPELGWLTATNRNTWSDTYKIITNDAQLSTALHDLQSALCILSLDDNPDDPTCVPTEAQHAAQIWHGNITNSANRWMDKSMQITVNEIGGLGYVGEHSMMDGMPAMMVSHYLMNQGRVDRGDAKNTSPVNVLPDEPVNIFKSAFRALDPSLQREVETRVHAARQEATDIILNYGIDVLTFQHFGSDTIKMTGCSPDAFAQMAIQLACYRIYGEQVGTYEATQMRAFLHGRTETTRSVSLASQAFVKAMCASNIDDSKKHELLLQACKVHAETTRKAAGGTGVDRHFYGLTNVLKPGEPTPSLIDHELTKVSKRWKVSTSTVPGVQCGFSSVEHDGVGIGYDVKGKQIVFTVTGQSKVVNVRCLNKLLSDALNEMMHVAQQGHFIQPTSRL